MKYQTVIVLASALFMWSCEDDDAQPNPEQPQNLCDSLDYTYNDDVMSIINANCATPYCHGGGGAGGVYMADYAEIKTVASGGKFLKAIKHEVGASAMPKNQAKLSDADIQIIECWVQNGLKEK
ncbi:MAG: c-type cytochrome [Bacteroidia bacterium]|nr:c-type cytochrome [Bacteroidia bacterium]NNJ55511.1 hypothetical protein [Bacteroidia bacterium]